MSRITTILCHIKDIAEKWKSEIDERAYNALMNYTVEITD